VLYWYEKHSQCQYIYKLLQYLCMLLAELVNHNCTVHVLSVVTCYTLNSVLEAFALTCAVTIALTVYTLQSKRDFSAWGAG